MLVLPSYLLTTFQYTVLCSLRGCLTTPRVCGFIILQYFQKTLGRKIHNLQKDDESGARPPRSWKDLEILLTDWDHFIPKVSWGTFPLNSSLLSAHYASPGISISLSLSPQNELSIIFSQNELFKTFLLCRAIRIYSMWANRKTLPVLWTSGSCVFSASVLLLLKSWVQVYDVFD